MRRLPVLVIGFLVLTSGTALAQDTGDFSAGYRFMRSDGVNFATGWYLDFTRHMTDLVSVVGDIGGSYKNESETDFGVTVEADVKIHTFMGGAKFRASMVNPNFVPFGQVLFGVGHLKADATVAGVTLLDESQTDAVLSLAGGVDAKPGGSIGVRVTAGWMRAFEDDAANFFQLSIGAVFGF